MWKIAVGFLAFAGLALFILSKGGDIDMSGEKHGVEPSHVEAPAAPAVASAASTAATPAAPAASAPSAAASASH